MWDFKMFKEEFDSSIKILNTLEGCIANEENYLLYLENYQLVANYNFLRLSINSKDSEALNDYELVGKINSKLESQFNDFLNDSEIPNLKYKSKHLNLNNKLYNKIQPTKGYEKFYSDLVSEYNLNQHIANLYSTNEEDRKIASEKLNEIADQSELYFSCSLNNIKKQSMILSELRGFENVFQMTCYDNKIDVTAVHNLMVSLEKNKDIFQMYLKNNHVEDYYNVLSINSELHFTYQEAIDLILEAFLKYDEKVFKFIKKLIENNLIDHQIKENKSNGAFCVSTSKIKQSYILLNFTGTIEDVFTLVHEIGHAYHYKLLENEKNYNQKYPLCLAESASMLFEKILYEYLKDKYQEIKSYYLLDQVYLYLDIYSRFLFEDSIYQNFKKEAYISNFNELFLLAQKQAFGNNFNSYNYAMWFVKSHYYDVNYNYYNFPYLIGNIISQHLLNIGYEETCAFLAKTSTNKVKELLTIEYEKIFQDIKNSLEEK